MSSQDIHTQTPSDFDPRDLLHAFVRAKPETGVTAEEAVLSWLISLPAGVDPARAAAGLRETPPFAPAFNGEIEGEIEGEIDGEAGRLRHLLREIAAWPADRLPTARRSGRRALA